MNSKYLVTGGAGFIGNTFVRKSLEKGIPTVVLDKLTYAGDKANLAGCELIAEARGADFELVVDDICNAEAVRSLLERHQPTAVLNFAAESHVDNSIRAPFEFIRTNVTGAFTLLSECVSYCRQLSPEQRTSFRYVQISTDEVFGSLGRDGYFNEESPYAPNSPYSASKAAADHLTRAWFHTYGLPTIITNCSNNYGPRQHHEKLIPHMILNALKGRPLPIYGDGKNVRDWIHVEDHCEGIALAVELGRAGESYCFGGMAELENIALVKDLCGLLDAAAPRPDGQRHEKNISFVKDRPGHDRRYAIDDTKAQKELGFKRKFTLKEGLKQTVEWYVEQYNRGIFR